MSANRTEPDFCAVTVNGVEHQIEGDRLSYEQVAALAGKPGASHLSMVYHGRVTIDGERYEKNGSLIPGESVKIHDGMHFSAVHTGNA